jgi:hypothetical protein
MIRRQLDRTEGKPDRLLLYVDQWEELYAQAASSSDKERANHPIAADVNRFIDLLLIATQTAPVTVVSTVRADFYDPLIGHDGIRSLLPAQQVLLAKMSRSELESTIIGPAKKVRLAFDPDSLVQRILDETGNDESVLPLLQYALKESWALRRGNTITADSYAGGCEKPLGPRQSGLSRRFPRRISKPLASSFFGLSPRARARRTRAPARKCQRYQRS